MQQTITLTLEVEREDDTFVALCPELDVASYGDTVDEALARLIDMVSLYLETIEQDGERDRILRERNILVEDRSEVDHAVRVTSNGAATNHVTTQVRFAVGAA